jgi:hypothetical protein
VNTNSPKRPATATTTQPENIQSQIRLRAFELYQDRGGKDGHEVEDWLRAEAEITGKKARAAYA